MSSIVLGCDTNSGGDTSWVNTVKKALESNGHTVETLSIGPGAFSNYDYHNSSANSKIGVYIMADSLVSVADHEYGAYKGSNHFSYAYFIIRGDLGRPKMDSREDFNNNPIGRDNDCNYVCDYLAGKTYPQMNAVCKNTTVVFGTSPNEGANELIKAMGGKTGSYGDSNSSSSSGDSSVSPLLSGDMTFEELMGEICNGIDLLFLVKRTVCVVDDFESILAEAKYLRDKNIASSENIKLWQLEEDTYEMEVNQHGFYNTVYVNYKDGVIEESYEDLVRVYGKIPIRYKHPKLDKTNAIAKAKAYLAAHIRDFNMTVNLTMLADGDIDIGDIVTVENPMTLTNKTRIANKRDPEYLFVKGKSVSWEGDDFITADIECTYAPESPERLEVPSSGTATGSNDDSNSSSTSGSAKGSYSKCGVSSDKKTLCAIGKASASGESKYGTDFYRSVYENKCAFCGKPSLIWDIFYAGNESSNWGYSSCKGSSEGGSAEGHIFCTSCDADFSVIEGKDHESPPRATLKRIDGPTKVTKQDAYSLKKGTYSI